MSKGAEQEVQASMLNVSPGKSPFGTCMRSRLEELDFYPAHFAGQVKLNLAC